MSERRLHPRSELTGQVKIRLSDGSETTHTMRNLSDTGLCVERGEVVLPEIGAGIQVQIQAMDEPAPWVKMCIIRITDIEIGLQYCD